MAEVSDADLEREIQQSLERLGRSLPESVDVVALGVRAKAPYKAMAVREALIWRTEELGRCAYQMFQQDDIAAAILLTRGVVECAALMGRLAQVVFERALLTPEDLDETLMRMLMGWKSEGLDLPHAFNVLTLLEHLDRRFGAVRRAYEQMSEFAHPNWGGVSQLFSRTDQRKFITYFGRFADERMGPRIHAMNALAASLAIFEHDYDLFADTIRTWLPELEKL